MDFTGMIGNKYMYYGHEHVVEEVNPVNGGGISIRTDKTILKFKNVKDIAENLLPIEKESSAADKIALYNKVRQDIAAPAMGLHEALMDVIQKIKANPNDQKLIAAAKQMNESAQTVIELTKVQLDMVRVMKELTVR